MTDKELLELAAKAAGIKLDFDYAEREGHGMYFGPRLPIPQGVLMAACYSYWNPLTDDGDALRLAVKCQISFWQTNTASVSDHDALGPKMREQHNGDPYAATRRAIVRAAAEIGKAMP